MTFPKELVSSFYYNGKTINGYKLSKLETLKPVMMKLVKSSENGIALIACLHASTEMEMQVSKKEAEKGTKPLKIEAGSLYSVNFNIGMKDFSGKDSEEKGIIETFQKFVKAYEIKDGEIFYLKTDMGSVPPKGLKDNTIKIIVSDDENTTFLPTKFNEDDFAEIVESLGLNHEFAKEQFEFLSGATIEERKQFQKKDPKEYFLERFKAIKSPEVRQALEAEGFTLEQQVEIMIGYLQNS